MTREEMIDRRKRLRDERDLTKDDCRRGEIVEEINALTRAIDTLAELEIEQ
jgi:hypothetical protein